MGIECYVCNKWSQNKCEKDSKRRVQRFKEERLMDLNGCVKLAETKTLARN